MTDTNGELAWKVYDRIEQTVLLEEETGQQLSEGWDQGFWACRTEQEGGVCRTSYCFAGWTSVLAGDRLHFELRDCILQASWCTPEGSRNRQRIEERAGELLGLRDVLDCDYLFTPTYGTLDALRARVEKVFGARPGGE